MSNTELFLHSCQKRLYDGEVIVSRISEIDNETKKITPKLKYFKNPKRSFWITKPKFRNHKFKREVAPISELDKYTCYNYELPDTITKALDIYSNSKNLKYLCKSPYIYGADIKIEALIKMSYIKKYGLEHLKLKKGFLDIETSIANKNIILISYTHENKVYTAILKSYMYEEKNGKKVPFSINDVKQAADIEFKKYIKKYGFEFNFFIGENEVELVKWIMKQIFINKTDFIGIWNMNFDIPYIINRMKLHNENLGDIFIHPDVPEEYRYVRYNEDKAKTAHFTLKWNWLYCTGYSQFIDSMGLYSQCRKTAKFRTSYKLDDVLKDDIDTGKLSLGNEESHFIMQTRRFKDYILYNMFDVIGLQLLEWKNQDITQMMIYAGVTPVSMFAYKTIYLTNKFYFQLLDRGLIISSASYDDPLRFIN